MWMNATESIQTNVDIPEGEYTFPDADKAIKEYYDNKNKELLESDPKEYLIGLLNSLNGKWTELSENEKEIAETIIKDTCWEKFSMENLFTMDIQKKSELLRKLSAIKKYTPVSYNDMIYGSMADWLRQWKDYKELRLSMRWWTIKNPNKQDIENFFKKAKEFQLWNMLKLYNKTFPLWSTDIPAMHHVSFAWDINWHNSVSDKYSDVWREYFEYDLSSLDD